MDKPDFTYKRKPAFISFLIVYLFCFGVTYLLIGNSPLISKQIAGQILARLDIPHPNPLWNLPYGIIFSIPFFIYGIRRLIWNLMSGYEINPTEIRLLTGSLSRKEHFYAVSDFYGISFKQNLLETPLGIGCIILNSKKGGRLIIRGVYHVKSVVEVLRSGLSTSY